MHTGSDYDYYKVNLASGYSYIIKPRVHDMNNSGDGNTYTNDVLFSYHDGTDWSEVYDDTMSGDFMMLDGGTLYLWVAPYFQGTKGTYLLDVKITRTITTSVPKTSDCEVEVFPNPSSEFLNINCAGQLTQVSIFDISGRKVRSVLLNSTSSIEKINIADLDAGSYFILTEGKKEVKKQIKFVKQ